MASMSAKAPGRADAAQLLLVEDNFINQTVALRLLQREGYAVEVAANGREALAALAQRPFDLVLMDLQMPEMDGIAATRAIREKEQGTSTHLRIIALTAYAMKGDRELCLEAGMDAYVTKPIQKSELFQVIQEQLAQVLPTAPGARSGEQVQQASGSPAAPAPQKFADVFDRAAALEHLDGDGELLAEGATMFLEDYPTLLAAVQTAIERGDGPALMSAAHTLKGSLATFAAAPAVKAAQRLELMGKQCDLAQAGEAWREMEAAVELLKPALDELRKEFTP